MKKVYLFEDHDYSLEIWRKNRIRGLDLVHVDAHIDFGFHQAEPVEVILEQARSVQDLKRRLEYSQAYCHFEKDFSKQLDIGNYIYPAMREGIVRDFYWVVPGSHKEFLGSKKAIIETLRQLIRIEGGKTKVSSPGRDSLMTEVFGRKLYVCTLESLPKFEQPSILDIDIDFLVTESANSANNTAEIGRRRPWVLPKELKASLESKIIDPRVITIAYSCNGGYTPMKYRHLGDELAYLFEPKKFRQQYKRNKKAARCFDYFLACGKRKYYQSAARVNPAYLSGDNNYGPLYLMVNKFCLARKEFLKIKRVDRDNPGSLTGLGILALKRNELRKAKMYFSRVLKSGNSPLFKEERLTSLIRLAEAEYRSGDFTHAKLLLTRYQKLRPLDPFCRYLLGKIAEKQKSFDLAARYYREAIRLGFAGVGVLYRLAKISFRLKEKDSIIKYISQRLRNLRKEKRVVFTKREKKILFDLSRFCRLK
jgi:tetratricopeptide (TPR) repeat protein